MNFDTAKKVLEEYNNILDLNVAEQGPMDRSPYVQEALDHGKYMLREMEQMLANVEMSDGYGNLDTDEWEKFMRWLGFLQGIFWITGTKTLNQMREDNRG